MLAYAELLDDGIDASPDVGRLYVRQHCKPRKGRLRGPVGIYRHELGQIPDSMLLDISPWLHSSDRHRTGGGADVAEQKRYEGALAGSVRPGDSQHLSLRDLQRKILDCLYRAAEDGMVGFRCCVEFDHMRGLGRHELHAPDPARPMKRDASSKRLSRARAHPR